MSLKGTLKDFSVADIFQLIGQQQKSGSLLIRTGEKEAHIVFDEGKVVLGTFRKSDDNFLLGTMLLRAGMISSDQLSESIAEQKQSNRSLGDILISKKAITTKILSEFISLQLKEVLFLLFQWKSGFYEFLPEKIRFNKSIIRTQSTEGILMDAFRMLDEWPMVKDKISSFDQVYEALVTPDEIPVPADPEEQAAKEIEKNVLSLHDGHRSLQEVINRSRLGTFETCRITAVLLDHNFVRASTNMGTTRFTTSEEIEGSSWPTWIGNSYGMLLLLFVLSLILPIIGFGLRSSWNSRYGFYSSDARQEFKTTSTLTQLNQILERERLENELEIYRLEQGAYPSSLEMLSRKIDSRRWTYQPQGNTYRLTYQPEN